MKNLVIITFNDKESFLIKLPYSVNKEQVEKVVKEKCKSNWAYDDIVDVIVDELGGEFIADFMHLKFYV